MGNPYFRFKQFTIRQDRCAMKVSTDACILGAWISQRIPPGARVLDIGCGTGLLMLMIAQRHTGKIEGIELDRASFAQLEENIAVCPWKERIYVYQGDVRSFVFPQKFDFMVVNPPFFEDALPSPSDRLNLAKHSLALTLAELLECMDANLVESGSFGILLPYYRLRHFEELAEKQGFFVQEQLNVRQRQDQEFYRIILLCARNGATLRNAGDLVLRDDAHGYSRAFVDLMKDYYLYM